MSKTWQVPTYRYRAPLEGVARAQVAVKGVEIALGNAGLSTCWLFDRNGDGRVTVDELVLAVNAALNTCS